MSNGGGASLISGILSGVSNTISYSIQAVATKRQLGRQAGILRKQAEKIQEQVQFLKDGINQGLINADEARKRIANILNATSGRMQAAITRGIEDSIATMKEVYNMRNEDIDAELDEFNQVVNREADKFRKTWTESHKRMRDTLIRRNLAGSGAMMAFRAKDFEKLKEGEGLISEKLLKAQQSVQRDKNRLARQLSIDIRGARQTGAAQIAQALGDVGTRQAQLLAQTEAEKARLRQQALMGELSARQQQQILGARAESAAQGISPSIAGQIGGAFGRGFLESGAVSQIGAGIYGLATTPRVGERGELEERE